MSSQTLKRMLYLTVIVVLLSEEVKAVIQGLYPPVTGFSNFKPVKASSACGLQNRQMKYCMSSVDNATLTTCTQLSCLLDCCPTCGKSAPASLDLLGGIPALISQSSDVRPGSASNAHSKSFIAGSRITYSNLPAANVPQLGFSFCAWVKQQNGNSGALISKGSSYTFVVKQFDIEFTYTTKDAPTVVKTSTINNVNSAQGKWQHVAFIIHSRHLSVFTNGQVQRTVVLDGLINDFTSDGRIGQKSNGANQFIGLMQEAKYFSRGLSNREVLEAMNGTLPAVYGYSYCRCPPSHPRISLTNSFYCTENGVVSASAEPVLRLSTDAHPPEYLVDGGVVNYWISEMVENATVEIDLVYQNLQVFQVQILFYSPPSKGIKIERSRDGGKTFTPWQYFAEDCQRMFGLVNNGPLTRPDSVNCLQILSPQKSDFATISFQTQEPGPLNKPQRPISESGCKDFHCSPKLLEFVKATNVRISFYQHLLVTNPLHQYFGVRRILVSGTCDCYGHSNVACTMYNSNTTHNASYTCTCDARTFTEGTQCQRCKPLYRDKPFRRGMVLDAYPCKKCNCNDHATSCTYNSALDADANNRNTLGGGVCDNCMHNTAGRFCQTCKPMYFRPSGKALNAVDVCSPCSCVGAGIVAQNSDCQRDDSNSSIIAGQCQCKKYASGRQCSKCSDGYYYLTAGNPEGCISCECNSLGSKSGNTSCDITNGQCNCKTNVFGLKCSRCRSGFYGLSSSNPEGCSACNCDPWGFSGGSCDVTTGQCPCKSSTEGRRCHTCRNGYYNLTQTGCQQCRCNADGTDPAKLSLCGKTTGNCQCRLYVEGHFCDRCKVGYYGLSQSRASGCLACGCDNKGTIGNTGQCNQVNGSCVCKSLVSGRQCNLCKTGTYNLSAANSEGCSRCSCNPKGTVGGGTTAQNSLPCFHDGQCSCLTNVNGLRCDRCISGYYWNPSGLGCIPCNCNLQGSASSTCNSTGYCSCRIGSGVGGRRCDQCLPGYYGFSNGGCTSCGCSPAGSKLLACDSTGKCTSCKSNVQGTKCSQCKPGTSNLQTGNPYGCSGPPSEQGPPVISDIASRSLRISWFPPDSPNGLILRYELYRNNSLVYNGSSTAYNDTRLMPFTLYSYYIIVHTAGGSTRSVDSNKVYRTAADIPQDVRPPQMTNVLSRSMLATWLPPVHPNDAVVIYKLSSTSSRASSPVDHYNGNGRSFQVTSLLPFTVYNFTITACSTIGCAKSNITVQSTRSARPDSQPAPYVTPQPNGQSVFVYWDAPARPNGVILFYDLFMRQSPFTGSGTSQAVKLNPLQRNYTVRGLTPYAFYEFRIVSYTAQVSGDTSSAWTRVQTLENDPSGAEYISPRASAVSSSAVNVSWSPPRYPNGVITRYEIFRYELADLSIPILSTSSSGVKLSALVSGLKPYTSYQISVKACNAKGCTSFSSRTPVTTKADVPSGQGSPNVSAVSSASTSLSWSQPATLNGPLPVGYEVERTFTALCNPPPQVESGVRFSSFGYYQLPSSIIPDSVETRLELFVRTTYPEGLLFYAASSLQEDMFVVEIRSGKPWFIFDTETGPAAFTITNSLRIDDGKWHKILVTRTRRSGTITVDDVFAGNGVGGGSANVIGQISSVYVGGVPASFKNLRSDTGNVVLKRSYFIGCIRNMKYKNAAVDLNSAVQKANVEPLYGHCPASLTSGIHFKGGGYLSLRSGLFTGQSLFFIQVRLRTTYKSGLILFAHGTGTTSFAVTLDNGNITMLFRSPTGSGSDTAAFQQICNGTWHTVKLTGFGSVVTVSIDNVLKTFKGVPGDVAVNSNIYIGGVPQGSQAEKLMKSLSKNAIRPYGGCMRDINFGNNINVHRNVTASLNVALDGCPADFKSSSRIQSCTDPIYSTVQNSSAKVASDKDLQTFTEYLYRVKSYRSGITGFAESSWVAIRTLEGAPAGLLPPVISNIMARRITATWKQPSISGGLLTKYQIKAVKVKNASDAIKMVDINNVATNTSNLEGLLPFTMYNISIVFSTAGGNAESGRVSITTLEAAPEMLRPVTAVSHPHYLLISWQPPVKPNGNILKYELFIDGVTKNASSGFTYNATGLSVYTSYSIKIAACNSITCISATTSIYTGQLPPAGIHAPQLRVLGSRRIEVRWRTPDVLNGVISQYQVQVSKGSPGKYDVAFTAGPTTFQTILANMTPGTNHYVRIAAFTAGGAGFGNVSVAKTLESAPEDIPKPVVSPVSSSVLNVTIQRPLKPNGVVIYYVLLQDDIVVKNDTKLVYQGTGFLPYSRHTYRTSACTAKGCGQSDLAVVFTLDAQPVGSVLLVANAVSPRSFNASWNAVRTPNGIITYSLMVFGEFYINVNENGSPISYQTRNATKIAYNGRLVNTNFTYSGLLPYSFYRVQVNASNRAGFILSNFIEFPTAVAAPDGVGRPVIKAVNSTTLNVTWSPPGRANGIITGYQLIGIYPRNSGLYRQVLFKTGMHYFQLVSNLQPYTNYSFKAAVTGSGGRTDSKWTNVTTPEDIPEHIDQPKIVNIESRSIYVEISAPSKPNGKVIHYILYLNGTETNRTLITRFEVVNLQPFSFYVARLEACTVVGCKSSVTTKVFQTLQDVPIGQPAPTLRANGSRSVVISWSKPQDTNGIILSYEIQRRMPGRISSVVVGVVNATISANLYVDKSVKPWTTYEYRVIARTVAGGTPGPYSSVKTPEGDPEGIAPPTVTALSSSSLSITWSAPSIPNGHVTHYYIVTTGRRELVNRTTSLSYVLTGLGSYIEYPVTVSACTVGGCGSSASTSARTFTSFPDGQAPPTAEARSASSLRVRWNLPSHPNGPIVAYVLWRRTVEDVVSGNLSANIAYPTDWVQIYKGANLFHDDTGLGIYSLQSYKVMAITTVGNTSSNHSAAYRTAAAIPLESVNLTATAVDHSSARLSWTLPPLRALRGPAIRFDISYEIVNGPVFVSQPLQGNITETVIKNLIPSTRYAFKVALFNGAGSKDSAKSFIKTLDGSPEGFDAPTVYVLSATEVRVSWTAPRTPNGAIYNYTVYGNSKQYDTVSATTFIHVQKGFKPYIMYAIQVRACTFYSCTLSGSVQARTLSAAPGLINPPKLKPVTSTSIRVEWDLPVEPNGIVTGYKLFRRRVFSCPTRPIPVTKCTYVECSFNEEVCGGKCFNPIAQKCCNGTLHRLDATKYCCGTSYLRRNTNTDVCCGGKFFVQQASYHCCYGHYTRVPSGHVCCKGQNGVVVGLGNSCCGDVPFDVSGDKSCICGALYNRYPAFRKCCGGKVVAIAQTCCGNDTIGNPYDFDASKSCCGTSYTNSSTTLCCHNGLGQYKVHSHANAVQKAQMKCCGSSQIIRASSCCNNQSYDNATQVCSDRSSFSQTGCGNGQTCPKNQASSAYCNRCNFNPSKKICGSVSGYFDASANQTNNVKLCFAEYSEVLKNPSNPGLKVFVDQGLQPHSLYDYYITAFNAKGNSSSLANRTRTLMSSPEGISPPQATILSAIRIAITWSAPTNPNGVVVAYKLYRIKWETKQEVLVFSGMSFAHTDSQGLEAYTGYMYKLSVCTVLCTNVSAAALVYTQQAAPQNVLSPSLASPSATTIQVNWTTPGKPNGIITKYNVSRLVNGTYMSILPANDLGLTMTKLVAGLKPYTLYTFRVIACTREGCSFGPIASIRTLQAAPEGVTQPSLTIIDATRVEAEWRKPLVMNGILLRYVLYRASTPVYSGPLLIFRDSGLTPNTAYSYTVEVVTGGGGTNSTAASITTPESSPEGIAAPIITPVSSTQLRVSWSAPSRPNGAIIRYALIYNQPGKDLFTVQAQLLTSYTINGLKPFSQYEVRIQACTAKGCGTGNRSVNRTLEAAPLGQAPPSTSAKSDSIIELKWTPPTSPNGIIIQYEVTRRVINAAMTYVIYVGPAFEYIDTGLKAYTIYQYKVRARNGAGTTESSWISQRTISGVPQGLVVPTIVVTSGVSVQVSWQQPTNPNGLITQYEVRAREFKQIGNETTVLCCIKSNVYNVTVTGLKPATTYEFRIAARSDGGVGFSDWTSARTKEAPPYGISVLRSNNNPDGLGDGKSLQVLWNPPSNPNGAITNYLLYLDTYVVYQGLLLQTVIRRLQPYTNYSFILEACNSAGCTKGPNQNLITAEVSPVGQIPPTFGVINATSVTLLWRPPLTPNGLIKRYDILRRVSASSRRRRQSAETIVFSTNKTMQSSYSYTDSGLMPFSTYQYKIRAVNSKGLIDSDWATIKTAAASPTGLSPPNATALGGYSVRVIWSMPKFPNGEIKYYEVYRNKTKVQTLLALTFTDTKLNPVTLYLYSIRVCTSGGCTLSSDVGVRTQQAAPGEMRPPVLGALDSTRIRATWSPPSVSNGQIRMYQLRMSNSVQPVFEGLALQYVISGLKPYTSYSVAITACTSSGCGSQSTAASARTLEAVPQDISPPSLFILGSTIIDATWSPPKTPNGVVRYCTLRRDNIIVYNGTALRYIDTTAAPGTRYMYTISCTNGAGSVTSLPQQSSTTNPSAPQNVSTPSLRVLSRSSIEVTWQAPKKANGVITRYYVLYDKKERDTGTNLYYTAQNLNYYTVYEFRISACTTAGCTSGLPASIRTFESAPTNQSAPTFSSANIGARYVVVQWIQPQKPNGIITHYELRRRQGAAVAKLVYTGPKLVFNDSSADVLPNVRYEYQVMSFNGAGSSVSLWVPVTTGIAKPEQVKPVVVLQQDIKSDQFVFSVEEPSQPNGRITKYVIELIGIRNITLSSVTRGEANGLKPYTAYSVRVYACNTAGCSSSTIKIITTAASVPTGFSTMPVVESRTSRTVRLRWQSPTNPNGPSVWYQVNQRYTCPQSSIPPPLCVAKEMKFNASSSTEFNVTALLPYMTYKYKITAHNSAGSTASPEVSATTYAEDPVVLRAPNVTLSGNAVKIDWTRSFDLRSALEEYTLEENNIQAYTGNKLTVTRPNREVGVYAYIVRLKTLVNGKQVTIAAPMVKVNVGDVAVAAPVAAAKDWYEEVWFLALAVLVGVVLVLFCVFLLLRKITGERNVYVRERYPLPLRPKSKMGSRSGSRSTLDAMSEKGFPYLGTPSPNRRPQEILPLTQNLYSSRKELLGSSQGINQTPLDEKLSYVGPDDPSWDNFLKSYNANGKDRDSGLFDENNSPTLNEGDEPMSIQSFQRGRIVFPDTHL